MLCCWLLSAVSAVVRATWPLVVVAVVVVVVVAVVSVVVSVVVHR